LQDDFVVHGVVPLLLLVFVIASAAKQSILSFLSEMDCFASLALTARNLPPPSWRLARDRAGNNPIHSPSPCRGAALILRPVIAAIMPEAPASGKAR
jgi:hypothetical protein